MSGMFALFYTDSPPDFGAPSGLATLARYPAVVLQAEMFTATKDSAGRLYAEGVTPAAWLEARDVEPWAYVNPFWQEDARNYGGPGETFRRAQAQQIDLCNAWLRMGPSGARIPVFGGKRWAIDIRNLAYRDWLKEQVAALRAQRLFIDCGFYHTGAYHQGIGGPDEDRAAVIADLYAQWRAQGIRLVVNAGWEAIVPEATKPVYPFANAVDGVAIECPGSQDTTGKAWSVVSYRGVKGTPDLTRLRRVVANWRGMDKQVWLVCVWQRSKPAEYTYSPWPTFEQHADFWLSAAQEMGCSVSVFADNSHAVWRENWTAEWGETEDGGQRMEERLASIEMRLAALERALTAEIYQ